MSLKFGVDTSHALQNVIPLYGAFGGIYAFTATQTNSTGTSTGDRRQSVGQLPARRAQRQRDLAQRVDSLLLPLEFRRRIYPGRLEGEAQSHAQHRGALQPQMPRTEKYNNQGVFRPDLAQSVPLATPLKLADGSTLNSALNVPFAFSGLGGNSRYLTPPQYKDFEPRFGFAWQPRWLQEKHLVVRGGYGMSHAPISGFTQLPQPDFSATAGFTPTVPSRHREPHQRDAPRREPAGDYARVSHAADFRIAGTARQRALLRQRPLLPAIASAGTRFRRTITRPTSTTGISPSPGRPTIPPPWKWPTPAPWASTCSWGRKI